MASVVTRIINISGQRKWFSYIPPNGRYLNNGESVDVAGVLETVLLLGNRNGLTAFLADLLASQVTTEYTVPGTGGGGGSAFKVNHSDVDMTPAAVSNADAQDTALIVTATPINESMDVYVNGLKIDIANSNAEKLLKSGYFSGDNGVTARAIDDIAAGDKFFFNALQAGYQLDVNDLVSFVYFVTV